MAIAFVQQAQALTNVNAGTQAVTWTSNTTTGNLIVVMMGSITTLSITVRSVTDSQGNTYVKAIGANTTNAWQEIWYAKNITGGTTPTVTATFSAATTRPVMQIAEYSGLSTTNPLDIANIKVISSSATYRVDTPRTKTSSQLVIISAVANNSANTWTVGAGYGHLLQQVASTTGNQAMQDAIFTTAGEQTGLITLGAAANGRVAVVSFSEDSVQKGGVVNNYQSLRAGDGISMTERIR